jgi:hypothetical protein
MSSKAATIYVGAWLRGLGLGEYEATFRENAINEKVLPNLTAEDLKDMDIGMVGTTERCSTPSPFARWRRRQSTDAVIQAGIGNAACCRFDARSRRRASARYGDVLDLVDSTGIAARLERETVAFP